MTVSHDCDIRQQQKSQYNYNVNNNKNTFTYVNPDWMLMFVNLWSASGRISASKLSQPLSGNGHWFSFYPIDSLDLFSGCLRKWRGIDFSLFIFNLKPWRTEAQMVADAAQVFEPHQSRSFTGGFGQTELERWGLRLSPPSKGTCGGGGDGE